MITINIPAVSYAVGAVDFLVQTPLLLTAWRGRLQSGGLLISASGVTALCLAAVAVYAVYRVLPFSPLRFLEDLRDAAWFLFLLKLLGVTREQARSASVACSAMALPLPARIAPSGDRQPIPRRDPIP